MGQSTDAIICYGVNLDEDTIQAFEEGETDESCEREKLRNPVGYMAWDGKAVDGVEIVRHQSSECPRHIVAIQGTELRAWRGHPKPVTELQVRTPPPEWREKLKVFCEAHKLPFAEPQWWLCSDWS